MKKLFTPLENHATCRENEDITPFKVNMAFNVLCKSFRWKVKNFLTGFIVITAFFLFVSFLSAEDSFKKAEVFYRHSVSFLDQAEREVNVILKRNPQDKKAQVLLGKIYFKQKKTEEAFKIFSSFEEALDDEAIIFYAGILEEKNLFSEAVGNYEKVKISPFKQIAEQSIEAIKKKDVIEAVPAYIQQILDSSFSQTGQECGAEIILVDEEIRVTPDNREIFYLHFVARIINDRGKKLGEVKLGYDSTYEKITSVWARTITPTGKIIEVGKENIRDVSRYMEFPLYSNSRVKIISMPQVQEGSIIEYKATFETMKLVDEDKFTFRYFYQNAFPIRVQKFKVTVPKSSPVNIYYGNEEYVPEGVSLKPVETSTNEEKVYSWSFRDVPPIIEEPSMVPYARINPYITMTNFTSWEQIYKWWKSLYRDKIQSTDLLVQKTKELTQGVSSEEEKLRKIFNFCAAKIRYVAVEYGKAGYEPHFAEDIFINKYGDCKDQAMLLVSMLRIAGIEAVPVLISTRDAFGVKKDEPSIRFNHAIAYATLKDGRSFFLDPTAETSSVNNLPFSDQRRTTVVFKDSGPLVKDTPLLDTSVVDINMDISSKKGIFNVNRKITVEGLYNMYQRYFVNYSHPQKLREVFSRRAKMTLPDAQLQGYKIYNKDQADLPMSIEYDFQGKQFFTKMANIYMPSSLTEVNFQEELVSKEERKYPLSLEFPFTRKTSISLEIPQNFGVYFLPEKVKKDSPWISYKRSYSQNEGKIIFEETFVVKKEEVSVEEYTEFKEFYQDLKNVLREVPLFTPLKTNRIEAKKKNIE